MNSFINQKFQKLRSLVLNLTSLQVLLFFLACGILTSTLSLVFNSEDLKQWVASWFQNLSTEFLGVFLTYLLIELIIGSQKEKAVEQQRSQQHLLEIEQKRSEQQIIAISEIKSTDNQKGKQLVVERLNQLDLFRQINLSEVNLNRIYLQFANFMHSQLKDISMSNVDLQHSKFNQASLDNVLLVDANLQNTIFTEATLTNCNLDNCSLQNAQMENATFQNITIRNGRLQNINLTRVQIQLGDLSQANLENAILSHAKLQNVNFSGARLYGATLTKTRLENPIFDESTVLPDGSLWFKDCNLGDYIK